MPSLRASLISEAGESPGAPACHDVLMPRPQRAGQEKIERMVRLLRYLSERQGGASSADVKRGIDAYGGDSGSRLYRRDLEELKRRGLVRAQVEGFPRRSGIALARPVKAPDLYLTRAEHRELVRLATKAGAIGTILAPITGAPGDDVQPTARLLRYLEERCGQWVQADEVAVAVGISADRLSRLLEQIRDEDDWVLQDSGKHRAITGIELDEDLDTAGEEAPRRLRLAEWADLLREATLDPANGTGQLGLFAYSPEEVEQRLALIETARASNDLDGPTEDLLESAADKLCRWRDHLQDFAQGRLS